MAQHAIALDSVFHALSDPTRRAVLSRLGAGPASISDLAAPFDMALPSFMKHIRHLERTGWISTRKAGRVRTCTLETGQFDLVEGWLEEQRQVWEGRTDRLEQFVTGRTSNAHKNAAHINRKADS
ncbi:ArsR/SmtB family transcription factor [Nocardioides sp. Root151]|uniref:ArsR/SmtB family transcription factor n=1 Tax=Nocardioides sp. Root151 TaxID=1736475 RepID=UPI000703C05E|nr:helix-turn-helix transcriptional regulator [Nocardioides sp. Root151]KQZ70564.1 ArsR family transcriptional regulator [Nocardioides sp. Root151]